MKPDWTHLDQFRKLEPPMDSNPGDTYGSFFIPRGRMRLFCIAENGTGDIDWEHVSTRAEDYKGSRIPTWEEMCFVKDLFWDEEECVVQFHPAKSKHVNNHPHVLHQWKPTKITMPEPPLIAV